MRTIKFRCWNIPNELMYENIQDGIIAENEKGQLVLGVSLGKILKDSGSIIMQFTGLTDKNGKECFEGDILDNLEVVIFTQGAFMTSIGSLAVSIEHREIIGNIHENPELCQH